MVRKIYLLLRGKRSKTSGAFQCLIYLHLLRTKDKLESHTKADKSKEFYNNAIPSDNIRILEFNQYCKSDKVLFIIYADLESTID